MRHVFLALAVVFTLFNCAIQAADADTERLQGIEKLKESQSNQHAIVAAALHFAKASEMFAKAGDEGKATEMNSFLFWCKKKMSYQDVEQFVKGGESAVTEKLFLAEKIKPEADESQAWFDRADKFATENPKEHLLIAVRFFEVASRFIGTKSSIAAQERSLKEQSLAQEKLVITQAAPEKTTPAETVASPEKMNVAESADPIKKRVLAMKNIYLTELEGAHKATLDAFSKRETDARKIGNKKTVDEIKEERAAFEAKRVFDQIQAYPADRKSKIVSAWKNLAIEYDIAIKAFTKDAKDADADATEKEFKQLSDDYLGTAAVAATEKPGAEAPSGVLGDKTYVAWVTLANMKQRKGAVISLETAAQQFDAIVYAELDSMKWMAGSDYYTRSQLVQKEYPQETSAANTPIQIAISYQDQEITIYHNGKKYVQYHSAGAPLKIGSNAVAYFGLRVTLAPAECLIGSIGDVRVYSEVLTEAQIAALRPSTASGPKPWAWWTFEDGTCRDRMGRFAPGKPVGGAMIRGGAMILPGKSYYKAEQLAAKK